MTVFNRRTVSLRGEVASHSARLADVVMNEASYHPAIEPDIHSFGRSQIAGLLQSSAKCPSHHCHKT